MTKIDPNIKCVTFDWDGTLIDNVGGLKGVYFSFLYKFGFDGSLEEFDGELNGPTVPQVVKYLKRTYNGILVLFEQYVNKNVPISIGT